MSFKKKLMLAIGPLALALLIVGGLLYSPIRLIPKPSQHKISQAASSMSVNVLKGNEIKRSAMAQDDYLPFFGSSEYSRVNPFHPSVLAEKYHRPYTPFLLGAAGTQSLYHYFNLYAMKDELSNRKAVFIISPQWFVKRGVSDAMFSLYYPAISINQWLEAAHSNDSTHQYLAERLPNFSSIESDQELMLLLNKFKSKEAVSKSDQLLLKHQIHVLKNEDILFSQLYIRSKNKKIQKQANYLPETYDFSELDQLAYRIGNSQTNSNSFEIEDSFYTTRVLPAGSTLKNSQKKLSYLKSPEYSDFQAFLELAAQINLDILFIIPPVNGLWADYTGLSQDMLEQFSRKINYQLKSQGFNHVVDFTNKRDESYFMEDTIHMGWRGWLEMDRNLQEFLKHSSNHSYQMNSEFLTKKWQNDPFK